MAQEAAGWTAGTRVLHNAAAQSGMLLTLAVHRPAPASSAPQVRWQFPSLDSLLVVGDSDGQTLTPQAVVRLCFVRFCVLWFVC